MRHAARLRRRSVAAALDAAGLEDAGAALARAVLPLVPAGARVAVYESLPDEPPTGPLVEELLDTGHEVLVPVVLDDYALQWRHAVRGARADASVVRRLRREPTDAERAAWLGEDALATCGVVVTPGLSVDRHGTRLGQGGGCYDRALLHRAPGALVITLLHEGEASESDLPRDAHDQPVDGWVTTTGRVVLLR
ncbi:5-formyltetrahydrofolate cyclo-ligase [Intrasporangium flavum]|uniref:5-formyltetrahydrofolate cyclo-ligase n=1 Tax=Intrasporangium flavum TaxID=1428657 RepID=UPI001F61C1C5|nr:5-formyltetrahydrofolate cyclo-ligase [Intrasporangium flavum]